MPEDSPGRKWKQRPHGWAEVRTSSAQGVFSPLHKGPAWPRICVVSRPAQALTPEGDLLWPPSTPGPGGGGAPGWGSGDSSADHTLQLSGASDLGLPGPLRSLPASLGLTVFCSSASQAVLTSPPGGGGVLLELSQVGLPPTSVSSHHPPALCSQSSPLPPAGQLRPGAGTRVYQLEWRPLVARATNTSTGPWAPPTLKSPIPR